MVVSRMLAISFWVLWYNGNKICHKGIKEGVQDILHISRLGIIARNKEGMVMAPYIYPWENILNPTMTEAQACLQEVTFAEDLGFHEGSKCVGAWNGDRMKEARLSHVLDGGSSDGGEKAR
ncbi:hypothetical protein GOBAR_AA03249 [Gossypium barbadense]|uniref:RNase H type-1 domain-containing protein n=1 Tax=Gossypium barbadense TaxID=3634 RepID=A0A2P5YNZ8_GOSBA|nr:hypothetical protein GOBAR_AA03249 [Gossypium barbadense]